MANLLFPDEKNIDDVETNSENSDDNDSSSESGIADINSDEACSSFSSGKQN